MTGADTTLIVPVQTSALAVNDQVRTERFHRMPPAFPQPGQLREDPVGNLASQDTRWSNSPHSNGVYLQWDLPHALTRARADLTTTTQDPHQETGLARLTYPLVPNRWLVVRIHRTPASISGTAPPPAAAAWLVQSDYLDFDAADPGNPGTPYLWQGREVAIGAARDLDKDAWQAVEQAQLGGTRFLTADGCGLPAFHLLQHYNQNVFSVHDPLTGANGKPLPDGTVSYLVAGWYSHAADDPLTSTSQGTGPLDALLKFHGLYTDALDQRAKTAAGLPLLGWTAPDARPLTRTLYTGTVLALTWKNKDDWPSAKPGNNTGQVHVALGINTADARDALRAQQGLPTTERLLHRAFDSARLETLDQVLDDGSDALRNIEHDACFTASPAGCHWTIAETPVADGSKAGARPPTALTDEQRAALDELNAEQLAHDQTARELADAQRRLYDLWWLAGLSACTDPELRDPRACPDSLLPKLDAHLDPNRDGLAAQVSDLRGKLAALRAKVPTGAQTRDLTDSIAARAKRMELTAGQRLQCVIHPPYHRPQDPVVLLQGAGTGPELAPRTAVECRCHEHLVDRIEPREAGLPLAPTLLAATAEPGDPAGPWQPITSTEDWAPLLPVLREFHALDQAAGDALTTTPAPADVHSWAKAHNHRAHTMTGSNDPVWPSTNLWRQPWAPLLLLWTARIRSLPAHPQKPDPAAPGWPGWHYDGHHWHLDAGTEWHKGTSGQWELDGKGTTAPEDLVGRALLTPLPDFLVSGRIKDYLHRHRDADHALLNTLRDQATTSQICQTLGGLGAYLAQYRAVPHSDPPEPREDLSALLRPTWAVPSPDPDATPWGRPVAAGQFVLTELIIVDRFGRGYDHINPHTLHRSTPARSTDLAPNTAHPAGHTPRPGDHDGNLLALDETHPGACIQLQPRLQQAARTRFELVSPTDDHLVLSAEAAPTPAGTPDNGPVCGWLVPDHRNNTLAVYAADGTGLGEILITGPEDNPRPDWRPLPGSPWLTTDHLRHADFAHRHPHLGPLIQDLFAGSPTDVLHACTDLRHVIDEALLATHAPDDSHTTPWTLLAGRPVAVVRARLRIELADTPHPQPTWEHLLDDPLPTDANPLRSTAWPIRLGDAAHPGDGLIGYYTAPDGKPTDYTRLNTPYTEPTAQHYARPITPQAFPTVVAENTPHGARPSPAATAWVTMLVNPFAPLGARTGILPAATTRVPDNAIRGPLARIALCVPTGPLLATLAPQTTDPDQPQHPEPATALALPSPGSWHGTWTWSERTPPGDSAPWAHLDIGHTDALVHPPDTVPDVRTGYLTLTRPTTDNETGQ
ncbi:hypothetical protein [Streptomyces sp. enrichment culture]|uniref:hypothetical protein n=1 Tax=Streptomyces sp. enrichment culture TaxID=1795815 RepID=UPI003F5612A0